MNRVFWLLSFCAAALGDTPANCTFEEVKGKWHFYVGDKGLDRHIDCKGQFCKLSLM
jgi:hypothetical protein